VPIRRDLHSPTDAAGTILHTAKKIGAQVIAGVRGKELDDARSLGVSGCKPRLFNRSSFLTLRDQAARAHA
jgi:hypothetical protein